MFTSFLFDPCYQVIIVATMSRPSAVSFASLAFNSVSSVTLNLGSTATLFTYPKQ